VVGYSEADARAPFVKHADCAIPLGGSRASESYLDIPKVVAAAQKGGCQAVHPGYGFLSERPAFVRALQDAGITFMGPTAEVMEALGDKVQARLTAQAAGIPVVPGTDSPVTPEQALKASEAIGFPLLVKAAAGGGGKGMRLVQSSEDLTEAVRTASREATSAFGDGTVFLERYLSRPRHVEVQVLADGHGNVVHAFERECSVQRRHQKVVEECPAPVSKDLRQGLGSAAVALCQQVGYQGAGTVEFLVAGEEFFFLEMNTRIQVEHPVTELVTGLDLVGWQIEIAEGKELDFCQEDLHLQGHAIEARLYAEDPAQGFLPCPGDILELILPQGPGIRVDSGVVAGDRVTEFYDPMIAKIVAFGATREAARRRLIRALKQTVLLGVGSNLSYLLDILEHPDYQCEDFHVHWLEDRLGDWQGRYQGRNAALAAASFAEAFAETLGSSATKTGKAHSPPSPWETLGGMRL
jgi:acetyl-CoA/propionyl-CoA carboxylase biotin carboxyl carrier protein